MAVGPRTRVADPRMTAARIMLALVWLAIMLASPLGWLFS